MKQWFPLLLGLIMALLATAPVSAEQIIIRFSHVVDVDTPKGQAAEYFKQRVEERSNGEILVEVYPNSSLFNDKDVMPLLMSNAIQLAAPSFAKLTQVAPSLQLLNLPFLFHDSVHLHRVLDGPIGQQLLQDVSTKNLVGLAFWDNGFKHLSANRPLLSPEDAAGLKFRIMPSHVLEEQIRALDANPQVLPFSRVYSALQQKVVDGAENPLSNFYTQKFYEIQSDLTLTGHGYLGYVVITNKLFWNSLNENQQELIREALAEATDYGNTLALEMDKSYLQKVQYSSATRVHSLNPQQRSAWKQKLQSIYPRFYEEIGKELIEAALATD